MKIKGITLTQSQADVYAVIRSFPKGLADHALVPLAQHQMGVHQSSSGIRTRRSELAGLGLLTEAGKVKTGSGRTARVFKAVR